MVNKHDEIQDELVNYFKNLKEEELQFPDSEISEVKKWAFIEDYFKQKSFKDTGVIFTNDKVFILFKSKKKQTKDENVIAKINKRISKLLESSFMIIFKC